MFGLIHGPSVTVFLSCFCCQVFVEQIHREKAQIWSTASYYKTQTDTFAHICIFFNYSKFISSILSRTWAGHFN